MNFNWLMSAFRNSNFVSMIFFMVLAFEKSQTYKYLLSISNFFEKSFFHSFLLKIVKFAPDLYPRRMWSIFDSINKYLTTKIDLFHPVFILSLIFLGVIGISNYKISSLALFSIVLALGMFSLGVFLSGKLAFKKILLEDKIMKLIPLICLVGLFFLLLDLLVAGSIPLFNSSARRGLNVTYTMIAQILPLGGFLLIALFGRSHKEDKLTMAQARTYALITALAVTFLVGLLGFRTQIIVALLGSAIAMYYTRLIGFSEIALTFFVAFLSISILGVLRASIEGTQLGLMDVLGSRLGLTLSVYDTLVQKFRWFGVNHGTVFLASFSSLFPFIPGPRLGPRTMVARMFGVFGISMTSTLFGPMQVDFGIIGVGFYGLFLGFIVGTAYHAMKKTGSVLAVGLFALLMAYTLVGVETGIVDFHVLMFFAGAFFIFMASLKK